MRGAQLETLGLAIYAGHPELTLVNVPTAFIESGVRLLKELGTYVLSGGRARARRHPAAARGPALPGGDRRGPERRGGGGAAATLRVVLLA